MGYRLIFRFLSIIWEGSLFRQDGYVVVNYFGISCFPSYHITAEVVHTYCGGGCRCRWDIIYVQKVHIRCLPVYSSAVVMVVAGIDVVVVAVAIVNYLHIRFCLSLQCVLIVSNGLLFGIPDILPGLLFIRKLLHSRHVLLLCRWCPDYWVEFPNDSAVHISHAWVEP